MKLNLGNKRELRIKIERKLELVPELKRIHLDKEILEELLFDTYEEKTNEKLHGKKLKVKYLVWTGDFLAKIDLSEVSFSDVMWDIKYEPEKYFVKGTKNRYYGTKSINLKNTNAVIILKNLLM